MNKRVILLFALLLQAFWISAQTKSDSADDKKFSIGVRAGMTASGISNMEEIMSVDLFKESVDMKSKMKFAGEFGFVFNCRIKSWFYIQPGVYWSVQGGRYEADIPEATYYFRDVRDFKVRFKDGISTQSITVHYLKIPVLLSFRINLKKCGLFLNTGPYISVGMAGKYSYEVSGRRYETMSTVSLLSDDSYENFFGGSLNASRVDTGWSFGLALSLRKFILSASYDMGYIDFIKDYNNPSFSYSDKKHYNSVVGVKLGYDF